MVQRKKISKRESKVVSDLENKTDTTACNIFIAAEVSKSSQNINYSIILAKQSKKRG